MDLFNIILQNLFTLKTLKKLKILSLLMFLLKKNVIYLYKIFFYTINENISNVLIKSKLEFDTLMINLKTQLIEITIL